MNEQTIKCPICGNPYVVYPFYAGDQSACKPCRDKARAGGKHDSLPSVDVLNRNNYFLSTEKP